MQIAIIGFATNPPLQPIYLALGASIVVIGLAWSMTTARRGDATAAGTMSLHEH